jgi:hypothetical protein
MAYSIATIPRPRFRVSPEITLGDSPDERKQQIGPKDWPERLAPYDPFRTTMHAIEK